MVCFQQNKDDKMTYLNAAMFITDEADNNCRFFRLFHYIIQVHTQYILFCELNEPLCTHYELNFLNQRKKIDTEGYVKPLSLFYEYERGRSRGGLQRRKRRRKKKKGEKYIV